MSKLSISSNRVAVVDKTRAADKHTAFDRLVELMDVLRSPGGCPWDIEQTRETLKPMLIEEAHEVLHALDGPPDELCEELGDLLFQVIFHSRIGKEREEFDAYDVCQQVYDKMVRRHPHVFGDEKFADSQELLRNWEDIKAAEKKAIGKKNDRKSLLDGVPPTLPALYTCYQMTSKAARVGFDWPDLAAVRDKMDEEFKEVEGAVASGDTKAVQEEVGDLLFVAVNVARTLEIDPETALAAANDKFAKRFRRVEQHFEAGGRRLKEVSLEEMESVWQALKKETAGVSAAREGEEP